VEWRDDERGSGLDQVQASMRAARPFSQLTPPPYCLWCDELSRAAAPSSDAQSECAHMYSQKRPGQCRAIG
jgi:hypothetical protein